MRSDESAPTRSVVHVAKLDPSKLLACCLDKKITVLMPLFTTACCRAQGQALGIPAAYPLSEMYRMMLAGHEALLADPPGPLYTLLLRHAH
jgi:hypothetical protein